MPPAPTSSEQPRRDTTPTRRRTGERKIRQILDAAVQVVGAGGAGAVTHRAVAEAAGVPLGSTTYYFTDRHDLVRQTMEHAVAVESARLTAIIDAVDGPVPVGRAVELLTEMFFDKTVADPMYDLALFEMFLEATRDPSLRDMSRQWSVMIAGLIDRLLPPTDPAVRRADAVQIVATLIDGLMLEEASNQTLGLDQLSARLRVVVERLAA
ncbi:MAG TPA: TetR family transcriptional regulator [Cellulomonas sp.]